MKISRLLTATVLTLLISACSYDRIEETVTSDYIKASISPETKTSMGGNEEGTYKVLWSAEDEIMISDGKASYIYSAIEGGSSSAAFRPKGNAVSDFSQGIIAGYPVKGLSLPAPGTSESIIFTIPTEQTYVSGSFADGTMPMISEISTVPELHFRNVGAVLRFVISGPEPVEITSLTISTDITISGEYCYDLSTDEYMNSDNIVSSPITVLNCGEGVTVGPEGTAFHVVVPHQQYSSMNITATAADGKEHIFRMKEGKVLNVKRNSVVTVPLTYETFGNKIKPVVTIETRSVSFTSFSVKINMKDVTSYSCGLTTKKMYDSMIADGSLLASLPYETQYTSPMSFSGTVTRFQDFMADVLIESGNTYILWIAPYKESGEYTIDDITYLEVTTQSYQPGGTSSITSEDITIGMADISAKLVVSEDVDRVFNHLLSEEEMKLYPGEQDKIDLLIKGNTYFFEGNSDLIVKKFLLPGKKYTLLAIAIDKKGKYGNLFEEEYMTLGLPYNDLSVSIDKDIESVKENGRISWHADGAVSYRYILFATDSYRWTATFGSSIDIAEREMILDPGLYYIEKTTNPYALISNPVAGKEYVLMVVAVDAAGNASRPDSWIFTY